MSKGTIVVVEDEAAIRRGVVDTLRLNSYSVNEAADGAIGLHQAIQPDVDLVLLDLLLPKRDGLEVLAEVRRVCPDRPVIILTARGTEDDRVRGLKMGADDYVVKPFSARELLARVEAVLRRTMHKTTETTNLKFGKAAIDLARREITWPSARIELSETEAALLKYLFKHRTRAVSREEILTNVWGIESEGLETRTIDMHVVRLRSKLRDPSGKSTPEAIVTVRATGYMAGPDLVAVEDEE